MSVRTVMFAIAALTASAAAAQPYSGNRPRQGDTSPTPAPVVLASADARRPATPANAERPPEPARRPAPRVTSCRCGDPQPEQDPQDQ